MSSPVRLVPTAARRGSAGQGVRGHSRGRLRGIVGRCDAEGPLQVRQTGEASLDGSARRSADVGAGASEGGVARGLYSSGFSPRPKLSFGLALPTGCESLAEYLDVELAKSRCPRTEVSARLQGQFPAGIEITASGELEDGRRLASAGRHARAAGRSRFQGVDHSALGRLVDAALWARRSLPVRRERKGREEEDDLRPACARSLRRRNLGRSLLADRGARAPVPEVCGPRSSGGLSGSSSACVAGPINGSRAKAHAQSLSRRTQLGRKWPRSVRHDQFEKGSS